MDGSVHFFVRSFDGREREEEKGRGKSGKSTLFVKDSLQFLQGCNTMEIVMAKYAGDPGKAVLPPVFFAAPPGALQTSDRGEKTEWQIQKK